MKKYRVDDKYIQENPDRYSHFADYANIIPYYPHLRKAFGSVLACILFVQMEYWFKKMDYNPFWKYIQPIKSLTIEEKIRDSYKTSWTEDLAFSEEEFKLAFKKIGYSYKSKKEYDAAEYKFGTFEDLDGKKPERLYCSYFNRIERRTYFVRNHPLAESMRKVLMDENASKSKQIEANFSRFR